MAETLYDYERQAWIVDGCYKRCGHPESMACGCYGKEHAGEQVNADKLKRIQASKHLINWIYLRFFDGA